MVFLPNDSAERERCEVELKRFIEEEGQTVLAWRDVPVDNTKIGKSAREVEPVIRQIFIGRGANCPDENSFERKLYVIRRSNIFDCSEVSARIGRNRSRPLQQ